jgi:ATP-binding cassette subfamily B multidrug efflux pump
MSTATSGGRVFDFPVLKRIFGFVAPYRSIFRTTVMLTIIIAVLSPLRPVLIGYTIDHYVVSGNTAMLLYMTLLMIALLLLQSVFQYFYAFETNRLGLLVVKDLKLSLFSRLVRFRLSYFDKTPVGIPVTRLVSDMETVTDIFSDGLLLIIGDMLQVVAIIFVMLYIDWQLTIVSLSTIPLLFIATRIFQKNIKVTFQEVRTRVADLNTFVQEHLTGVKITQVFNREEEEMQKFDSINAQHRDANVQSVWYYSIFFPVVEILNAISIGLIVWWGAHGVMQDEVTFGTIVSFIMYISFLFRPIRELADKFNTLQMGVVSSERIFKLMDLEEREQEQKHETRMPPEITKGEIVFENVWFAYQGEEWILKGVSFHVKPGSTMALVGSTGAGKSTIINLLNLFYRIQKGRILIDGTEIGDFPLEYLRKHVAVVLQDVFLFSDSIYNNITLYDTSFSPAEVESASRKVGADHFIHQLPGGYQFNVQERGSVLSMGQRQLISFIRAFVHQPKILVLDEATSSIDTESEELITNATRTITQNRTSIVIAHRLATVQNADAIIVLDHGEVKEMGTHQELLSQNGLYRNLYEIQFKGMEAEQ